MSGLPLRPDRDSFGPTYLDSTAVRDPQKNLSAGVFNLLTWQVAGIGLLSPRVLLWFTANTSPDVIGRAEAWNPHRLTTGVYADPTLTKSGTGDYLVEYPTPIPDADDVDQAIAFSYAMAVVVNSDPSVLKSARAAPVLANPYRVRVCVFNAAGSLQDGNDVLLLAW
jgi:hypothetical protein